MSDVIIITSSTIEQKILHSCNSILAAFFPGRKISVICGQDVLEEQLTENFVQIIEINVLSQGRFVISMRDKNKLVGQQIIASEDPFSERKFQLPGKEPLNQIFVKRALFIFLEKLTEKKNPWGILTGIRPGKLLIKMNDLGIEKEKQKSILTDLYMVAPGKAELLQDITTIQRPFFQKYKDNPKLVSVYLTIPFCPSRCFYCSFPSKHISARNRSLLHSYLEILYKEIEFTADMMKEFGLEAENIYIGGGTPTVLNPDELAGLLQVINNQIGISRFTEFTVEAGRPDTIDIAKLMVMKEYGVNRISINPQTMQDRTLKKIGRNHYVSDILNTYYLARRISDWVINMDLIIGLPDEGMTEIRDSLEQVLKLKPDNLTVHALALKRGSEAWENSYVHSFGSKWQNIQSHCEQSISSAGYKPYYLYRQKNIVGNLENVGYAIPGIECRYNMAVIEEQQTVLGLGAGAASKILNRDSGHQNIYNPGGIEHYITGCKQIQAKRKLYLEQKYGV